MLGLVGHCAAGAAFGTVFERFGLRGVKQGVAAAALEGAVLWPGVGLVRRGVVTSPRAFAASLSGHVLFGALLGGLLPVPDYEA